MKSIVIRATLNVLTFLSLFFLFNYKDKPIASILVGVCLVLSAMIVYTNSSILYHDSMDISKKETLKMVTSFNLLLVAFIIIYIIMIQTKIIQIYDEQESVLASIILAIIILVLGNISPCLPFTKYTGLRLPWTVADEDTWIIAHRLLGYCSYPIGLCVLVTCFVSVSSSERDSICVALFLLWIFIPATISFIFYKRKVIAK